MEQLLLYEKKKVSIREFSRHDYLLPLGDLIGKASPTPFSKENLLPKRISIFLIESSRQEK